MNDLFHTFSVEDAFSKKKELWPQQTRGLEQIRQSVKSGNSRVVLQAATGFGKTLIAAKIIEGALHKGNQVIFTAPAIGLIDQTVKVLEAEGIRDIGVMQANHPRTNPLAKVQVASVQTLARRALPTAALVIVDECHIKAKIIEDLMSVRNDVCFIGMSATPWAKGMGIHWQDLIIPSTIGELIEGGYLSRFIVFAPDVPDMTGIKIIGGDYNEEQLAKLMQGRVLTASIVETWLAKGQDRPTLLFGVNRAHARSLKEEFEAAGIAAGYCDAFTDSVERKILERRFRSGEIKVACSVRTLTTGIDWPVSCIIDAAPTKSEILHVQKIGRGLRVNDGFEDLLILDHAGNSLRLGLVTDIHHTQLDTTLKGVQARKPKAEKLPKECAKCAALHTGLICPHCGHERMPIPGVETLDGELIELTPKTRVPTMKEKQEWWAGIKTIQNAKGRKDLWAAHTYREKFGVWPKGLNNTPGPATQDMWNFVKSKDIRFANRKGG